MPQKQALNKLECLIIVSHQHPPQTSNKVYYLAIEFTRQTVLLFTKKIKMRRLFFSMMMSLALLPIVSNAQWSSNPAENVAAITSITAQTSPKVQADHNGNFYIAMFSNADNYNIHAQRLDADGNHLWGEEGVLVSDHEQNSWISEWDMQVDHAGNCIIAFTDIRSGEPDVYVYKISPEGEFLWGENGISVSSSSLFEFEPKLCITDDNNVYVTWNRQDETISATMIQRITPEGELPWGEEALMYSGTEKYINPVIVESGNNITLAYFRETGPYYNKIRHIYTQKFDSYGNTLWPEDVLVSDKPGISGWTKITAASDGLEGIILGCRDDRDGNTLSNAFVQRITSEGNLVWPNGGIELSTDQTQFHGDACIAGMTENGDVVAGWTFKDSGQSTGGVKIQRISQDGERVWTDDGVTLSGLDNPNSLIIDCNLLDNVTYVTFARNQTGLITQSIYGQSITSDGNTGWAEDVLISSRETGKTDPKMSEINLGQMIVGWIDGGENTIARVQNLKLDGSIGIESILNDDATLADLSVDGETIEGFNKDILDYTLVLNNTEPLPVVGATSEDANATILISQTTTVPGNATVVITAEDGTTQLDYTIHFDTDVSFTDHKEAHIKIYPNPVAECLHIENTQMINSVEIMDLTGRTVWEDDRYNQKMVSIMINDLKSGSYYVRINHCDIRQVVKK